MAGRGRAIVTGVGSNTAMGSIHDSMLRTDDVSLLKDVIIDFNIFLILFLFYCIEQRLITYLKREREFVSNTKLPFNV